MKLAEYLTGIQYTMNDQKLLDTQITGITSDSRQVKKGCIFVCIKGGKFDGHTAAPQAVAEGAAVVVTETDLGLACQVLVENTRSAYAILC
ncbi:MAG: Mur ligase domain-containing protein, partial [Angelakisella sp.]